MSFLRFCPKIVLYDEMECQEPIIVLSRSLDAKRYKDGACEGHMDRARGKKLHTSFLRGQLFWGARTFSPVKS